MVKGLFDTQSDLAAVVRGLPPDHAHGLTFHLPLEVQALDVAGASREVIGERVEQRLPAAFAASLIDPPLYRWAETHYGDLGEQLLSSDVDQRRRGFDQIVALGPGLAGGAFHPLIRFGYGALRQDPHEITRGLAYLRVRRQVLFAGAPRSIAPEDVEMPTPAELDGTSVFEQLDLVAGERAFFPCAETDGRLPEVATLAATALGLVRRNPSSFIAIHTVTGLHAMVEVDHLLTGRSELGGVPDDPLLEVWWRAMTDAIAACAVIEEATAPAEPPPPSDEPADLDALVQASIGSDEVHDLKLSVSLRRLVELGVAERAEALTVGAAKLAATISQP
jgi:hypothetical protein